MKFFKGIKFNDSFDKVVFFQIMQLIAVLIAFLSEALDSRYVLSLTFVVQLGILLTTFNFYFRALKNLQTSFWNISFILTLFYIISFFRNILMLNHPYIATLYLISLALMGLGCYIIASPLYYPQVTWWEYDFRYRPELPITIEYEGEYHRARLTDLRRGAGCVMMFHPIPVGQTFMIISDSLSYTVKIKGAIRSKKEPIMGRAIMYGVKFKTEDLVEAQRLKLLTKHWNETKHTKLRSKFALGVGDQDA